SQPGNVAIWVFRLIEWSRKTVHYVPCLLRVSARGRWRTGFPGGGTGGWTLYLPGFLAAWVWNEPQIDNHTLYPLSFSRHTALVRAGRRAAAQNIWLLPGQFHLSAGPGKRRGVDVLFRATAQPFPAKRHQHELGRPG